MGFDTVVFSQRELCAAVESGLRSIALCDGEFELPLCPGIYYTGIGAVRASVRLTERAAAEAGIVFDGFFPEFEEEAPELAFVPLHGVSASEDGSYSGSFASSYRLGSYFFGSYFGSYSLGSFSGSYFSLYEFEYEFETGGSYSGSYSGSYTGSYTGSFGSRYGAGSYIDPYAHIINPFILVNGYGIDLI